MHKLLGTIFSVVIFLSLIWVIIGYETFGDELINKHVDVKSVFTNFFDELGSIDGDSFFSFLSEYRNFMDNIISKAWDNFMSTFTAYDSSVSGVFDASINGIVSFIALIFSPLLWLLSFIVYTNLYAARCLILLFSYISTFFNLLLRPPLF